MTRNKFAGIGVSTIAALVVLVAVAVTSIEDPVKKEPYEPPIPTEALVNADGVMKGENMKPFQAEMTDRKPEVIVGNTAMILVKAQNSEKRVVYYGVTVDLAQQGNENLKPGAQVTVIPRYTFLNNTTGPVYHFYGYATPQ